MRKKSKPQVEITGWEAKFYDQFLQLVTLGRYSGLLQRVISDILLNPSEVVMDLGAGTGKNAERILKRLNPDSRFYALEIGSEMRRQLRKRQLRDPRIIILNQRIETPFQLSEKVSLAFISFVIHGLTPPGRLQVIENVHQNLRDNGKFCILDYNHFNVDESPWFIRFGIRSIECETTEDFINQDFDQILTSKGFTDIQTRIYFRGYLRLLCCRKG